jgi:hypothetical protein
MLRVIGSSAIDGAAQIGYIRACFGIGRQSRPGDGVRRNRLNG